MVKDMTDEELLQAIELTHYRSGLVPELVRRYRSLAETHEFLCERYTALDGCYKALEGRRAPLAPPAPEKPVAGQGRGKTHCRCGAPLDDAGTCVSWSHSQQYERSRMSYGLHTVAPKRETTVAASVTVHEPGCACAVCFEGVRTG